MLHQGPDVEVQIEFELNNHELDNDDHTGVESVNSGQSENSSESVPTPKPVPRRSKRVIKPPNRLDL